VKEKAHWFWSRLPQYNGIPEPAFSEGWLDNFKARHGIKSWKKNGEAASVDEPNMAGDLA
jgi:uncharacterized protein YegP (UPF0339 family)